ncbi:MAG: hypothetical protein QOG38_3577, partial [Hyphomicrobiales bacterium]|nr:hypothetical protein [Hyphomicrobiales bacterium]
LTDTRSDQAACHARGPKLFVDSLIDNRRAGRVAQIGQFARVQVCDLQSRPPSAQP